MQDKSKEKLEEMFMQSAGLKSKQWAEFHRERGNRGYRQWSGGWNSVSEEFFAKSNSGFHNMKQCTVNVRLKYSHLI